METWSELLEKSEVRMGSQGRLGSFQTARTDGVLSHPNGLWGGDSWPSPVGLLPYSSYFSARNAGRGIYSRLIDFLPEGGLAPQ